MGRIGAGVMAGAAVVVIGGVCLVMVVLGPGDTATVLALPGGGFLLLAAFLLAASVRLWRSRTTPLVIDSTGRVGYGCREIIASGSAKTVRLDRTVREVTDGDGYKVGEAKMCLLYVECIDGRFVALPELYFSEFDGWEFGEELAKALAAALRVPVSTGPVPTPGDHFHL